MSSRKFIAFVGIFVFLVVGFVSGMNYVVDPYGLYNSDILRLDKPEQSSKMKLVKALKIESLKPKSITLGTSRTEFGYDPSHSYFIQPAYNLATSGASMYENRMYFEKAINQGNLEKVLIVADWIMFNTKEMKKTSDFETYFNSPYIYNYLLSIDSFKDSFLTIKNQKEGTQYLENGQRDHNFNWKNILKSGGHLKKMNNDEKNYYRAYSVNYTYKDTRKQSFPDFEEIIELCYENEIELDIIFGPSHIRQWEAFAYYHDYDIWLQWKKDVVLSIEKVASKYYKKPFRVMDFSVYHPLTAEEVPKDPKVQMKWHWEGSHYKHELGLIVLDRLTGKSQYKDFGVKVDSTNIDKHLENLKKDRHIFIDTKKYREEVFND